MKYEIEYRIERTRLELMKGLSRKQVIDNLSKEFGIAPSSVGYFITQAYKEMEQESKEKKDLLARVRNEQLELLARTLVADRVEVEAFLSQVLRGERMEEKVVYTALGPEIIKVAPKISDLLKAINLYMDRYGSTYKAKDPPLLEPLAKFFSHLPMNGKIEPLPIPEEEFFEESEPGQPGENSDIPVHSKSLIPQGELSTNKRK